MPKAMEESITDYQASQHPGQKTGQEESDYAARRQRDEGQHIADARATPRFIRKSAPPRRSESVQRSPPFTFGAL
jgi:hypothetical protein